MRMYIGIVVFGFIFIYVLTDGFQKITLPL